VKAAYGKTVRAVWAADGGQRFTRASSDPTILTAGVIGSFRKNREACVHARVREQSVFLFAGVPQRLRPFAVDTPCRLQPLD